VLPFSGGDDAKTASVDLTKDLKSKIITDSKDVKSFGSILPEAKSMKLVYTASKDGWAANTFH